MNSSNQNMVDTEQSVLDFREKLAFFIVNFGNIPIMTMMSSFLLLFYTDVVGLDPVAIGTLFLVSRIMDGLSDPIMGFIIDHLPPTKLGRFRGYLILGAILTGLNFLLVWMGPSLATSGKLVIAYISYLLIGWTFDLMDIPLNSMIPVMSDRERDRDTLSTIKGAAYLLGSVAIIAGVLPLVSLFSTKQAGFHAVIIGVAGLMVLFSILGALGIKERVFPAHEDTYHFTDILHILAAKPVLILFITTLLLNISRSVTSAALVYFFLYVLKRPDLFSLTTLSSVVGIIAAVIATPLLVRRFGKKVCLALAAALGLTGSLIQFFIPTSQPLLFVIVPLVVSPSIGLIMILFYGIQADNVDYIEWQLGYRAEAAVASMSSFILKAAGGVGGAIVAYLLAFFRYVPNAEMQSSETLQGLYYINFVIPSALFLAALLIWAFFYPLTKEYTAKIMEELTEQRKNAHV